MNNNEDQEKLAARLDDLILQHKILDTSITVQYNKLVADLELRRLKTKKLWLKDKIHLLKTKLGDFYES